MNIKYYLSNSKKESTIRACFITDRNHQFKIQTSLRIEPKYLDKKIQRAKSTIHGSEVFNESLTELHLDLLKQIRIMKLEGIYEWHTIKQRLKAYMQTGSFDNQKSSKLISAIEHYLYSEKNESRKETVRKYKILRSLIQQFESKYKSTLITASLDFTVVEKFRHYILFERNNRNDTAYKVIASLKAVFRWLLKEGYQINSSVFTVNQPVKSSYEIITLNEDEITLLKSIALNPVLGKIRDCFIFQIYTGQRFSDMQQLSPNQVKDHMWTFRSVKNR